MRFKFAHIDPLGLTYKAFRISRSSASTSLESITPTKQEKIHKKSPLLFLRELIPAGCGFYYNKRGHLIFQWWSSCQRQWVTSKEMGNHILVIIDLALFHFDTYCLNYFPVTHMVFNRFQLDSLNRWLKLREVLLFPNLLININDSNLLILSIFSLRSVWIININD